MPDRSPIKKMQIACQIIFGAGAVVTFWLPVYAFLCARKALSCAAGDE